MQKYLCKFSIYLCHISKNTLFYNNEKKSHRIAANRNSMSFPMLYLS